MSKEYFSFEERYKSEKSGARIGILKTPHVEI